MRWLLSLEAIPQVMLSCEGFMRVNLYGEASSTNPWVSEFNTFVVRDAGLLAVRGILVSMGSRCTPGCRLLLRFLTLLRAHWPL